MTRLPSWIGCLLFCGSLAESSSAATLLVWKDSPNPAVPYSDWGSAARTIQEAIDASTDGDTVLVTNGVYDTGGRRHSLTSSNFTALNRVTIDRAVTLLSVNGPEVTLIQGAPSPGGGPGPGAYRCAYVLEGATVSGFTLTGGYTGLNSHGFAEPYGGGAMGTGTLTNCILSHNEAELSGGGAYGVTLDHCQLRSNSSTYGGGVAHGTAGDCLFAMNSATYLGGGAYGGYLIDCMLTGNVSMESGGGASDASLVRCQIYDNTAGQGGGAIGCLLYSSVLVGNTAYFHGGAAYDSSLWNCTATGNEAGVSGGGVYNGRIDSSIVYFNRSQSGPNYASAGEQEITYSCTVPLAPGEGNIDDDPQLASATHLSSTSPCLGAGDEGAPGFETDIDGEPWLTPRAIGADQLVQGQAEGLLPLAIRTPLDQASAGFPLRLTALDPGPITGSVWDFGDGVTLSNTPFVTHAWSAPGAYEVVLRGFNDTFPAGVSVTSVVEVVGQPVAYVDPASATPLPPYDTWATAATGIQEAIDISRVAGRLVLVTNGVYATGGTPFSLGFLTGSLTNRIALRDAVEVRSVNGADVTVIQGAPGTGSGGLGTGAVRCAWIGADSVLDGFTLTNGRTFTSLAPYFFGTHVDEQGGGALAEVGGRLKRCVLVGNRADGGGGMHGGEVEDCDITQNRAKLGSGVFGSTVRNSRLTANEADNAGGGAFMATLRESELRDNTAYLGGGAYQSELHGCLLTGNEAEIGGGAYDSHLLRCTVEGNRAEQSGGGLNNGEARNCVFRNNVSHNVGGGSSYTVSIGCVYTGNRAVNRGGGVQGGFIVHCTITGNTADVGGGVSTSQMANSICYFNTALFEVNYTAFTSISNSCITPLLPGSGNMDADPRLSSASHLSTASPCLGAGHPAFSVGVDIDGQAWLQPPAIGADQVVSGSTLGPVAPVIDLPFTQVASGYALTLTGDAEGAPASSAWDFGDGTLLLNAPYASHTWSEPGTYIVRYIVANDSFPGGISATALVEVVEQPVTYVNQANATPRFPFSTWATAATNIQEAIGAVQVVGRLVLVTNGVYATGGVSLDGNLTNRIALTNAMVVRSVNGPEATQIVGRPGPNDELGLGAIRCAYVGPGAILSGFTLTNGHTLSVGFQLSSSLGGGALQAQGALLTNSILAGNMAVRGGGVGGGTVRDGLIRENLAVSRGGGATDTVLMDCELRGNGSDEGGGAQGSVAHRCLFIGNVSQDDGGATRECVVYDSTFEGNSAEDDGGAVFESELHRCLLKGNVAGGDGGGAENSVLYACRLEGNTALEDGGGADDSDLFSCVLTGNTAIDDGGAVDECDLYHCTLTGNTAWNRGGGTHDSDLFNCIVYFNKARLGPNHQGSDLDHSCTTPLPPGDGNIDDDPRLASDSHLSAVSPCLGAGAPVAGIMSDIDGETWLSPPSMGADEVVAAHATGDLHVAIRAEQLRVTTGFEVSFQAVVSGRATFSMWEDAGGYFSLNSPYASRSWDTPGNYAVLLRAFNQSHPTGVVASVVVEVVAVEAAVHYVNQANPNPAFPYDTWLTAATNIQDAIDASNVAGRTVWVANGVYATGGRAVEGTQTNRVALTNPVHVRSVSGPEATVIAGRGPVGSNAVRGAYLADLAVLSGFTLTNGHSWDGGDVRRQQKGGGAWGGYDAILTNCIIHANTATESGGGVYGTTVQRSLISTNLAGEDGGGADDSLLIDCRILGNQAYNDGGGVNHSTLINTLLIGNRAGDDGGAGDESTFFNCTLVGNLAGNRGGGLHDANAFNSIVLFNAAGEAGSNHDGSDLEYCCTNPALASDHNFNADPGFAGPTDYRLTYGSPCIDAGTDLSGQFTTDLLGLPRPLDGDGDGVPAFDVGAYEFDLRTIVPPEWFAQYGLDAGDPHVLSLNPDLDVHTSFQEWVADTNPTNGLSFLRIESLAAGPPASISFVSSSNRVYTLLRNTNRTGSAWVDVPESTRVPGSGAVDALTDPAAHPSSMYQLRVDLP